MYTPIVDIDEDGNKRKVYKFDNGYGASVIQNEYSYGGPEGKWELAVIKFEGDSDNYDLTYTTDITDDVLGYLTWKQVVGTLNKINKLKEQ